MTTKRKKYISWAKKRYARLEGNVVRLGNLLPHPPERLLSSSSSLAGFVVVCDLIYGRVAALGGERGQVAPPSQGPVGGVSLIYSVIEYPRSGRTGSSLSRVRGSAPVPNARTGSRAAQGDVYVLSRCLYLVACCCTAAPRFSYTKPARRRSLRHATAEESRYIIPIYVLN